MKNDINILKLLLDNPEESFTIRKIAERLGINYRIAYERTAVLEKEGLLRINKVGNSKICKFTHNFNSKVYEAEYLRRQDLFRNKDFLVLHKRLASINSVFVCLVFGSHVKGKAGKGSDIDLLTIGIDEKKILKITSSWPENIHLTAVEPEDFVNMAKSREFTAVSEAVKKNIILLGTGEYYRLLKNAGYSQDKGS